MTLKVYISSWFKCLNTDGVFDSVVVSAQQAQAISTSLLTKRLSWSRFTVYLNIIIVLQLNKTYRNINEYILYITNENK